MGEKGLVFALLRGREIGLSEDHSFPPYVIFFAFKDLLNPGANVIEQMRAQKKQRPNAELPIDLLPMLVRFRDISDPLPSKRSIRRISQKPSVRASRCGGRRSKSPMILSRPELKRDCRG
jgi:hypothetical protein